MPHRPQTLRYAQGDMDVVLLGRRPGIQKTQPFEISLDSRPDSGAGQALSPPEAEMG